jgi:glycosyltransferase involved in cell wall biosynthesis
MKRFMTIISALSVLTVASSAFAQGGIGWTISSSAADPHVNTGTAGGPGTLTTLFLHYACNNTPPSGPGTGMTAMEADLSTTPLAPLAVMNGFLNAGTANQKLQPDVPMLLFVGRIQPLKGPDVAIRALDALGRPEAQLVIVGGASGSSGDGEFCRAQQLVDELGLHDQVHFVDPQPHHILSTYYRAADVVVVPSRSESFGLVALEAAACGTPVVASAVGGLQSLVDHAVTGYLIADRDPAAFAKAVARILDEPLLAEAMSAAASARASRYTWGFAAARLRRLYTDLTARQLVLGE